MTRERKTYISTEGLAVGSIHETAVHSANSVLRYHSRALERAVAFAESFGDACDYLADVIIDLSDEERVEANWSGCPPHPAALALEDTPTRQCAVATLACFFGFEEPDYSVGGTSHDADAQEERRQMGITC